MAKGNSVRERIRNFILEKFPLARKRGIRDEDHLLEQGVLDSLGVLELVGFLEREFSIRVSDEELVPGNFQTVRSLAAFAQTKWDQAQASASEQAGVLKRAAQI